ncbi:hypothetical protein BCV69DRAFT_99142 [Microstroma glucosiphilum]|uniref:Uncharacterized protein n=1 Tax=Pseudomicrostroma glucosiphilum TaxID=1684307 RepID=A0A316UCD3_9BASI|nr:hypothetical protein BCV69DRAFT_99142 [Pseudomicrostroma glucosiphilum]PWN22839.1 hypothetical protein BCV69DRAFT_99142 [Pseudomicrostroma glucosiphilum]
MDSYRPSFGADDDPYANGRSRSPPPAALARKDVDYDLPHRSRSPDYSRGAGPRGSMYRSVADEDRERSRSPYGSRHVSERDVYDRGYDRYAPERERAPARYTDEYGRDRYGDGEDGYRNPATRYRDDGYYEQALERDRQRDRGRYGGRGDGGAPIPDPLDAPSLLPFKQFAQVHRQRQARLDPESTTSNLTTQEMFDLYKRYKAVYTARSARKFWEEKKGVAFFLEKYGMGESEIERRRERRRLGRKGRKRAWFDELQAGKLDKVTFEMHFAPLKKGGRRAEESEGGSEDSSMNTVYSRYGEPIKVSTDALPVDPSPTQLLIMRIPPGLSRRILEAELARNAGFQYLALGEAHANKQYYALGWAVFDNETNTEDARRNLLDSAVVSDNKLQLDVAARGAQVKFRTAPSGSGSLKRLAKDLKQARDVVKWAERDDVQTLWPEGGDLDEEDRQALLKPASNEITRHVFERMGLRRYFDQTREGEEEDDILMQIHENARAFDSPEDKEEIRLVIMKVLDLHLDLLREVYHCDYYSSTICDFGEELDRRARAHFRRCYPDGETEAEREGRDAAADGGQNMGEEQWAENLDRKHLLLVESPTIDIEEVGGVDLDKLCLELATPFIRQDDKEKHRCIVEVPNPAVEGTVKTCDKLFKALIFVQKHVCNKHKDLIERELGGRREDITYLNNYVRDPTRVMPPLQQSGNANGRGYDASGGSIIRMGPTSFGPEEGGRRGGRRRSASPGRRNGGDSWTPGGGGVRLSDRLGQPPPIHLGGSNGLPPAIHLGGGSISLAPLHLRLGAQQPSPALMGMPYQQQTAIASPAQPMSTEPLPPPPRPLDPRAARGQTRSYQDLDVSAGGAKEEEVMELEY